MHYRDHQGRLITESRQPVRCAHGRVQGHHVTTYTPVAQAHPQPLATHWSSAAPKPGTGHCDTCNCGVHCPTCACPTVPSQQGTTLQRNIQDDLPSDEVEGFRVPGVTRPPEPLGPLAFYTPLTAAEQAAFQRDYDGPRDEPNWT